MSIEGFIEFLLRHRGERGSPLSAEDAGYLALIFLSAGCCFVLTAIHQWHHRVDVLEERRVQQRADIRRGGLPVERRHLRPEEGWVLLYVYGPAGLVLLGVGVVHLAFGALPADEILLGFPLGIVAALPGGGVVALYPRVPAWMVPPRRRELWRLRLAHEAAQRRPYRLRRHKQGRVLPTEDPLTVMARRTSDPVTAGEPRWKRRSRRAR